MSQDTAKFSTEVLNEESSVHDQELIRNCESFQAYMREGEEADKELSSEDFKMMDYLQKILNKEALMEHNYKREFQKAKNDLERLIISKLPIHIKTKMADSIRENLQKKLDCLRELNKTTKDMVMKVEKTNNYSTYLNMIHRWKEASKFGKASSMASTHVNSYAMHSDYKNSIMEGTRKDRQSFLSNQSLADDLTEEQKTVEEMKAENFKLEDMIANLKQSRNLLILGLDCLADDMEEYQEFVESKKVILQDKLKRIEHLKYQISLKSSKKSTNIALSKPGRSENDKTEIQASRVNMTVINDVSNKVSGFFGKMFKKKDKVNTEKILPTEFFTDINTHTPTHGNAYTQSYNNLTPKSQPSSSTKRSNR